MKNYGNLMYGVSDRILKVIAAVALAVATLSVKPVLYVVSGTGRDTRACEKTEEVLTVSGWLSLWMQERGL